MPRKPTASKQPQSPAPSPKPRAPRNPPFVDATATACPACGSTERERYFHTVERPIAGVGRDGKPFTHVVWRRTRCTSCGQVRVDRTYENRPPAKRRAA